MALLVGLFTFGAITATSQAPTAQAHVGEYSRADIIRGSQLYAAQRVACHGLNGAPSSR
jgi:cytochrome c